MAWGQFKCRGLRDQAQEGITRAVLARGISPKREETNHTGGPQRTPGHLSLDPGSWEQRRGLGKAAACGVDREGSRPRCVARTRAAPPALPCAAARGLYATPARPGARAGCARDRGGLRAGEQAAPGPRCSGCGGRGGRCRWAEPRLRERREPVSNARSGDTPALRTRACGARRGPRVGRGSDVGGDGGSGRGRARAGLTRGKVRARTVRVAGAAARVAWRWTTRGRMAREPPTPRPPYTHTSLRLRAGVGSRDGAALQRLEAGGLSKGHAPSRWKETTSLHPLVAEKSQPGPRVPSHKGLSFPGSETGTARLTCDVRGKGGKGLGLVVIRGPVVCPGGTVRSWHLLGLRVCPSGSGREQAQGWRQRSPGEKWVL